MKKMTAGLVLLVLCRVLALAGGSSAGPIPHFGGYLLLIWGLREEGPSPAGRRAEVTACLAAGVLGLLWALKLLKAMPGSGLAATLSGLPWDALFLLWTARRLTRWAGEQAPERGWEERQVRRLGGAWLLWLLGLAGAWLFGFFTIIEFRNTLLRGIGLAGICLCLLTCVGGLICYLLTFCRLGRR